MKSRVLKYFAAANGYCGFRSYFNSVFNPMDYDKLIILKGGPGTGKSSLMKKISKEFSSKDFSVDEIYCSSDKGSLDGVIIKKGKRKVGIIDGTAPHLQDTSFPGLKDKILNLGEFWDEDKLKKQSEDIIEINRQKRIGYKLAYEKLYLAGQFNNSVKAKITDAYKKDDSTVINDIISNIKDKSRSRIEEIKLISCFGKDGYSRIDSEFLSAKNSISVTGEFGSEFIFMDKLRKILNLFSIPHLTFPSPFSDDETEAIYIIGWDTLISNFKDSEKVIDTLEFLDNTKIYEGIKTLKYYEKIKNEMLELSREHFLYASDNHFRLEGIYTAAMDFSAFEDISRKITKDFQFILN